MAKRWVTVELAESDLHALWASGKSPVRIARKALEKYARDLQRISP